MSETINPTNPSTMNASMALSRKIHKQLVCKKNRWKPSELELTVLKLNFQKNKYPAKEDKEAILKSLEEQFNSKIDINQLSRWFQHEREKSMKNSLKGLQKNTYKKFGKEELDYLQNLFDKNNYPKMEEMIAIAKKLGVGLSKIENWYKHNRRSLAKRGYFTLKTKKYFKRDELSYLVETYESCPRPTKEQILEMAEKLGCSDSQIKNWYSNKRKKLKFMSKKQTAESTEASYHKLSSGHSKPSSIPDSSSGSTQDSNISTNLSFHSNSYQQLLEQKPSLLANSFLLSRPAPSLSNSQLFNTLSNNSLPLLVLPTNLNTSSAMTTENSMIINANTSCTSTSTAATNNDKESRPSLLEFQASRASQEAAKVKLNALSPSQTLQNIQNLLQSKSAIQIPVPKTQAGQNQHSQFQSVIGMLPNNNAQLINQQAFLNASNQNGGLNLGGPLLSVIQNPYSYPMNNLNAFNQMGSLNTMNPFSQLNAIPAASNDGSMKIQYLTSLYLPYSNNNIYNYPVMYANGSQPQISLGNMLPNGSVAFNSH